MNATQISKYEVVSTLGRGSMGVVYKARDPEIGRIVAIKTLRSVFLGDDPSGNEALQRFRQESRSAGKLHHPNIVTIYEAGRTDSGSPFIVMEYIDGQSLESLITERAPLEPLEVLNYLGQVASAIDYAHSQSVIHRDIKPSNVIVDSKARPHLLDFGVAKLSDTSLTPAGTVVGTPSYMSPEQIRGEQLDGSTDRFAFAVLAFEMFTGSRPFPGSDFTTVVSNIIQKPPLTFADCGATKLPAGLEKALQKGLSKDKTARFKSCLEFVEAVGKAFGVVVDGSGVPGYRRSMKLEEVTGGATSTMIAENPLASSGGQPAAKPESRANGHAAPDNDRTLATTPLSAVVSSARPGAGLPPEVPSSPITSQPDLGARAADLGARAGRSGSGFLVFFLIGLLIFGGGAAAGILLPGQPLLKLLKIKPKADVVVNEDTIVLEDEVQGDSTTESTKQEAVSETTSLEVVPSSTTERSITEVSSAVVHDTEQTTPVEVPVETTVTTSPVEIVSDETDTLLAVLKDPNLPTESLIAAISRSADLPYETVTPVLLGLAGHSNYQVRIAALRVFTASEKFKTKEVFRAIVSRMNDPEPLVRGFTVKFIASLDNEAALKLLENQLKSEKDSVVQKVLNDSIGKLQASMKAQVSP